MFNPPVHAWSATINGLAVPNNTMLDPGKEVEIVCKTMCGDETARGEYILQDRMSIEEAARRAQLAASIQHVTRRGCLKCRDAYQHGTNAYEKDFLRSTYPELGPIIGLDVRGKYGVLIGEAVPEELGETDQGTLDTFREEGRQQQQQLRELREKMGKA